MKLELTTPDSGLLVAQAKGTLELVGTIVIDSQPMFESAAIELQGIKAKAKALDDQRKAITKPLDDAKKQVMDLFRQPLELLDQAEGLLKRSMLTYQSEQDRIRREEQRKLEEAAAKERARLAAEAAAAEAAARAKAEEQRRKAEEAAAAGKAEQAAKLLAKADATEQAGTEKAQILQTTAAVISAPIPVAEAPAATGISTRGVWKAEVSDLMALVKAVAAGDAPVTLLQANTTAINQTAKALKSAMNYPGIRVWQEQTLAARAA